MRVLNIRSQVSVCVHCEMRCMREFLIRDTKWRELILTFAKLKVKGDKNEVIRHGNSLNHLE
jgi:hypothetical protein